MVTLIDAWSVSPITNQVGDTLREGGLGAALRIEPDGYFQVSILESDLTWFIDSMWIGTEVIHRHGFGREPMSSVATVATHRTGPGCIVHPAWTDGRR
jgi:hypothetical protein